MDDKDASDDADIKQELLDSEPPDCSTDNMDELITNIGEENLQLMGVTAAPEVMLFNTVEDNDPLLINSVIKQEPKPSPDLELIKRQAQSWRVVLQRLPTHTHTDTQQAPMDVDQTDPDDVALALIPEGSEQYEKEEVKYVNTQDYLDIGETVICEQDKARPGTSSKVEDLPDVHIGTVGSEVDEDEPVDNVPSPVVYRIAETETLLTDDMPPEVTDILTDMDRTNDDAVRTLLPADRFSFDWRCDLAAFQGAREPFTGIPGPTFSYMDLDPVDVFLKFWDDDVMDLIVNETNRYADQCIQSGISRASRATRWKPTNRFEMYTFFAMMIHQSITPFAVEKEYWSSPSFVTVLRNWKTVVPYDRWLLLKKFLHFNDNSLMSDSLTFEERRLYKVQPIIDHLNSKFQSLYLPNQNLALDDSLTKRHGRLGFIQEIATKTAKTGIKSYEICDSRTAYLWKFSIYAGKDTKGAADSVTVTTDARTDETGPIFDDQINGGDSNEQLTASQTGGLLEAPQGATAKIVYDLASGLFNKGYTIVMDNFYNSPLLARCLKMNGMDCYGTLRLNRDGVPDSIKSLTKTSLNTGNVVSSTSGDVNVIVWKDTGLVSMLSTYHASTVGIAERYGTAKYEPSVVVDYNKTMASVDTKDQLLAGFPLEGKRNSVWYKELFRRLLNASILNAYVIYRWKNAKIEHRDFRRKVADGLLTRFFTPKVPLQVTLPVKTTRLLPGHSNKNSRPVIESNHFSVKIDEAKTKYQKCKWCGMCGRKNKTSRKCDICDVPLCQDCMKPYHTGAPPRR